jgi:hypothetical protein
LYIIPHDKRSPIWANFFCPCQGLLHIEIISPVSRATCHHRVSSEVF